MLRSSITCAGVVLLGASAFAQSSAHSMLRPITSNVRDAGVYHYGLGTWTRHADTVNGINNDVIYANTCPTGYYAGLLTKEYVADEGRIPGPNGPVLCDTGRLSTNKGCSCTYDVCGFQIAYCSGLPGLTGPVSLNIGFQQAYTACALPSNLPKSANTFDITGLPGAGLTTQGCWLVTVDLDAASATLTNFAADGASCTWTTSDLATNHLFGWTFQNQTTVTGVGTSYVGPLIAGSGGPFAPVPTCSQVDMTRWDTLTCAGQGGGPDKWPNNMTEDGWGMDTQDRFRDDTTNATGGPLSPPSGPGCYYFGGNPGGSFHLKLFADTNCPPPSPGVDTCRPVEDGLTCPCGPPPNQPTTPNAGCNALNTPGGGGAPTGGGLLTSTGNAVPYDQAGGETGPGNRVEFVVTGLPQNASSLLVQGTMSISPLVFGQGVRCCGGPLKRLTPSHVSTGNPGTSMWPAATDFKPTISERSNTTPGAIVHILPGQTYCYFAQFRNTNIWPGCTAAQNFNKSQTQLVLWHN